MKRLFILLITISFFTACNNQSESAFVGEEETPATTVGTIPDESIYNLEDTFVNQDGQVMSLKDFSGKPTVAVMIYTHCTYACPRLTADIMDIEKKLGKKADDVHFVLISFDPENDTPEELKKYKEKMKLDDNFMLLRGEEDAVRTLSVLLNVQYQKNPDNEFSHSNIISILDKQGKLVSQKEGINANHTETVQSIKELL